MCKVLIFGCIAAVILMTAAYGAPLKKTKLSTAQKENFLDFYTPNDKQECNHTTLACFLKELKVLKQDVEEEDKQLVINIEKNLEDFMDPDFSNPTCKKCEANEKKKFPEFHQEMTRFLQSMQKEIV
ncbi:interleukin-15-like [Anomalospiza imberbis]|uniref:interleukin-15-like n=1 Tax=Anomalospiza imberbis TaxID=187417 RepID=UPI00358DF190